MKLRLTRAAALLVASSVLALFGSACGDGYTEADATLFCDQEQSAIGDTCWVDGTYEQCRNCYMDCGNGCNRGNSCEYTCEE